MVKDEDIGKVIEILRANVPPHPYKSREPFKVLIATVISQRTKDEVTYTVAEKLFGKYPLPRDLKNAPTDDIAHLIYPAGFYNQKAKKIKEIAKIIDEDYDGKVPDNLEDLLKLPGVGRKTANIVLSRCYDKDVIAVDTHVHRISNRLGWVNTKTPEETERELMKVLPKKYWKDINELLVMFGRTICRPVAPKCDVCPIKKYCKYYKENKKG
ncbi:base excision DNA repair protein, HhH-GPD family [Aciduliprofundum boonei T469]|nr:base excision DNA repair protein, HhH-GPD family [Aciduliprofundum boonei T469]